MWPDSFPVLRIWESGKPKAAKNLQGRVLEKRELPRRRTPKIYRGAPLKYSTEY